MNRSIGITAWLVFVLSGWNLVWAGNSREDKNSRGPFIEKRSHDFGTLARGAKAVHRFKIKNPHDEPLVIDKIRSSCGCTQASITKQVLKPREEGFIVAEFNTRSYLGKKSATITIVLNRPAPREIQLQVQGNIRSDLVFEPGEILINNIRQGESKSVSTMIHYAGVDSWKIKDIKSSLEYLVADLAEIQRSNGSVKYKLTITMDGDYPEGLIRDQLTLVTNDEQEQRITLSFSARVTSTLNVSSKQITFKRSEHDQRRLVFRSSENFVFTKIKGENEQVTVTASKTPRKTQLVTISYSPMEGTQLPGGVPIRFETSLGKNFSKTILIKVK